MINGDFKVVMHSTDTNNCGETEGREDCASFLSPLTPSLTHTHTRTHTCLSTHKCKNIGMQTFKEFTYGTMCTITSVAVHIYIDTNLNPMYSLEAFGTDSSPTTER